MSNIQYKSTAYNSRRFEAQEPRAAQSAMDKVLTTGQELLPWTHPIPAICTSMYSHVLPSRWQRTDKSFCSQHSISGYTGNGWLNVYLFICGFAHVFIFWGLPVIFFTCILAVIGVPESLVNVVYFFFSYVIIFFIPSCILLGYKNLHMSGHYQLKFMKRFLDVVKVFELNRETGMVTLFKKRGKAIYSRPFLEFDCIFQSMPLPNGVYKHDIFLKHRYESDFPVIPLTLLMGEKDITSDYYRLWNMIQTYMDVSQPLPDTYYFEDVRELDPTTKDYDEQIQRNPTYWRDMDDDQYIRAIDSIRNEQRNHQHTLGAELNIFK